MPYIRGPMPGAAFPMPGRGGSPLSSSSPYDAAESSAFLIFSSLTVSVIFLRSRSVT